MEIKYAYMFMLEFLSLLTFNALNLSDYFDNFRAPICKP